MNKTNEEKEYVHLPLNTPMDMGAGAYWIAGEDRLPFHGREVLCIIRDTDCITSCCGQSEGFRSVGVLGYIAGWHAKTRNGLPVSIVEPVTDEDHRGRIARTLQQKYRASQIEFF